MLRLALTPRWLVVALLLLVFIVAATLLGRWQWDRTQTILAAERAALSEPISVGEALGASTTDDLPSESIGRPVTAAGRYDPDRQVVIDNRSLDGQAGSWVVTGLRLADGALVPVLRGWVAPGDEAATAVPAEDVAISGVLQPDEIFYADVLPVDGQVLAISQTALEAVWDEDVPAGFIVLARQDPDVPPAPTPVPPTIQLGDGAFPLQNFFYAFQWWIFAAFGIFVYLRWLRIEAKREQSTNLSE